MGMQVDLGETLDALPFAAFALGEEERVLAANSHCREILGDAPLGRQLVLLLRAPDLHDAIADVRAGGSKRELDLRQSNGGQYRVTVSALGGGLVLCALRDISAEMKSEEIRRDFVANVSHELRTPLTAMMGFVETLRTSAREDAAAREVFLEIMEREGHRMHRLVQDLLQLSRVEAQERVAPKEQVNLAEILERVIQNLRPIAEAKGCRIECTGLSAPLLLRGDGDQLTQVFTNLVENAVKYGAADALVKISVAIEAGKVQISVKDQGEGIEPIHLPRLTERFYRVDRHRSRSAGGTGLGLAIVKHIVNRHRGQLKIESVKGEGSTFKVSLPMV